MFDRVLQFFTQPEAPGPKDAAELELAVAALMVEAARMDSDFTAPEQKIIERLLATRFKLGADEVRRLIEQATEAVRHSAQLFPFTREVVQRMPPQERVRLIEVLWKVVFANGVLDPLEDMLVRRIAGLIHVEDRDRAEARWRALAGLKASKP